MGKNLIWMSMVWMFLWLTGCGQVPPEIPATPTPLPTSTATQVVPTVLPLEETWDATPVLAYLHESPDMIITPEFHWMSVSDVVLYRDGHVIVNQHISNREGERWVLESTQLSKTELCQWLFDMDAVGFFNFAPSDYVSLSLIHAPTTYFWVRTWQEQVLAAYHFVPKPVTPEEAAHGMMTPVELIDGYWLLKRLQNLPAHPYTPERLQVLLYPLDYEVDESEPWTLTEVSLAERMTESRSLDDMGWEMAIFEATEEELEPLWSLLGEQRYGTYREGDTVYRVFVRPMLPLDSRTLDDWRVGIEGYYATEPTEPMTCQIS